MVFVCRLNLKQVVCLSASGELERDLVLGRSAASPNTVTFDGGPLIAFPGLVNSHDHLEFNAYTTLGRPPYQDAQQWGLDIHARASARVEAIEAIPKKARLQWGLLKNLLSGVTAVVDHSKTPCPPDTSNALRVVTAYRYIHSPAMRGAGRRVLGPSSGRPVVVHIGEGITENTARQARRLLRFNIFRNPIIGIHGIALSPDDAGRLRALVWCPVSNLHLFGRTADVEVLQHRTTILFGSDSSLSAPGSIWDHLRCARDLGVVSDAQLFAMVTDRAREIWQLPSSDPLADAAAGDIVVARRRQKDPWESFFALCPDDILLVIARGVPVLVDDRLWQPLQGCLAGSRMVRIGLTNSVKHVTLNPPDLIPTLWHTPAKAALEEFGIDFGQGDIDQGVSALAARP